MADITLEYQEELTKQINEQMNSLALGSSDLDRARLYLIQKHFIQLTDNYRLLLAKPKIKDNNSL